MTWLLCPSLLTSAGRRGSSVRAASAEELVFLICSVTKLSFSVVRLPRFECPSMLLSQPYLRAYILLSGRDNLELDWIARHSVLPIRTQALRFVVSEVEMMAVAIRAVLGVGASREWSLAITGRHGELAYRVKASAAQHSLRRGLHASAVPLQIPHDLAGAELREHLRYLLHLSRIDSTPAGGMARGSLTSGGG